MIEKPIPRDIQSYEAKLIGPLTLRQTVCGIPGLGLAVCVFFLLRNVIGDAAMLFSLIVAAPFMLCGWYKPYGIPFEKYVKTVFVTIFLAPNKRKFVSENRYAALFPEAEAITKKKRKIQYKPSAEEFRKI